MADRPGRQSAEDIVTLLRRSSFHMDALRAVKSLNLPDCWIGAGFVRNYVWDNMHAFPHMTPLNDIDVIYYDAANQNEPFEKAQEQHLLTLMPGQPWSVKNQARMHIKNGDRPYTSMDDALCHWCETVTPIAARLDDDDTILLKAPLGLDDLLSYRCHATPFARANPSKLSAYKNRMKEKKWWELWPKVTVHDL
ncbi:MAG: nucleotidyltransferase family protein [Rhodospirillales bacterium]|nr:nucleotidyltransferase family protein [Rhodospirillales bacterium]MCB9995475.1 nucleotidyltransferase family protein [Rhodospirillales bacterium]